MTPYQFIPFKTSIRFNVRGRRYRHHFFVSDSSIRLFLSVLCPFLDIIQAFWREHPSSAGTGLRAGGYSGLLNAASAGNLPESPCLRQNHRGLPEVSDKSRRMLAILLRIYYFLLLLFVSSYTS